tara:strand:+ start:57 stop:635 length:579 start_codon:yes stop_codon:yes gene_type:complete
MYFLDKYNNSKNIRFNSFKKTFDICDKRNLITIVETGTSRGKNKFFFFKSHNWKDGMSTIMFAEYAKYKNGFLYTCDISKSNIDAAKKFTHKFHNFIDFNIDDSVNFLKKFTNKIDLLYLDSLDGHNSVAASKHQLEEIKSSINKLHSNSLVLLDDKGTKTNLSIKFLLLNNFYVLFETKYQVLLSKNKSID